MRFSNCFNKFKFCIGTEKKYSFPICTSTYTSFSLFACIWSIFIHISLNKSFIYQKSWYYSFFQNR
ncbi:hypothetical protein [Deltalipothrixvirus pozzuoliense]|uniref:Uncharacterized protein ORF65 n=1 Tax=Acidianus filamentous virus 2 (isolate Italy/Pozzuoli) TaxID=654910 RepID=Y065_AFV2P|nr:hypothetical protein AFV2_gp52 [Acidianus filamentous virus 2]Q573B7.1 RecName: Full=Uncharacterized protein ORF65 [Acidianus filamentous virus 2 (isolate Pozzuoli)]CAH69439.1 hypothetical protein [Acidianus filamentous virus 2]